MHPLATFIQVLAGFAVAIALVATVAVLIRGSKDEQAHHQEAHH